MHPVPRSDLRDYAGARGLDHRGQSTQVGWMAALGMSEELQFNILRGVLPGGEHGLVFHDVRILEGSRTFGSDHATQIAGRRGRFNLRDLVPGSELFERTELYKLPCTSAAIRLPEASGLLLGLNAARPPERGVLKLGQWVEVPGVPRGWEVSTRTRADRATVDDVVAGPLAELLDQPLPTGYEVIFRFGTLTISQAHFAEDAETLDSLCEQASWLAKSIRAVCAAHAEPQAFGARLGEPYWLEEARRQPRGDTFYGGDYQNLGSVWDVADATGMTMEDPIAFMRAFPYLPVPGEVFGVLRGPLPGTSVEGRVAIALERNAMENKALQKALEKKVGGPFGCDAVMVPVDPATPETAGTEGEPWLERGRVAIKRGVLAAWRARERSSAQLHEIEALAADTLAAAHARGVLQARS
jgi:hypothetical protein